MKTFRLPLLALAAMVACSYAGRADALSYVMMHDKDLVDTSQGVAVVKVLEELPSLDGDKETYYRVRIERNLAGTLSKHDQIIALPGTRSAPHRNFLAFGVPRLHVDQSYMLFYAARKDGALVMPEISLGVFQRIERAEGDVYLRDLHDAREVKAKAATGQFHAPRDAAGFERWVADHARGVQRPIDYLRPDVTLTLPKYTFFEATFGSVTRPGRWMQFDGGGTQQWTAEAGGQTGATVNVFASLQAALAGWTNDAGSLILLQYAGTGEGFPIVGDPPKTQCYSSSTVSELTGPDCFRGHVDWNNTDKFGGEPYACAGGTLGLGGPHIVSVTNEASGQTWYTLYQAEVWIRAGTACFMDGDRGKNGIELLTHEVGHTLGFGHACGDSDSPACNTDPVLNAATMRASAQQDGRGATLGIDDQAAAAFAYPDADAVPPSADLSISSAASSTAPNPGATVTFTITVSNAGPDAATGVQVASATPTGLTFVSNSGACTTAFPCSLGTLASSAQAVITAQYTVSAGATDGQQITHTASVSSAVADPDGSDDSDDSVLTVDVPAGAETCDGDCVFRSGFEPGES